MILIIKILFNKIVSVSGNILEDFNSRDYRNKQNLKPLLFEGRCRKHERKETRDTINISICNFTSSEFSIGKGNIYIRGATTLFHGKDKIIMSTFCYCF